jgi:hypothetical protein
MRGVLLLTLMLFVLTGSAEGDTTVTANDANNGRLQTGYGTTRKATVSDIRPRNGITFNDVTPINKYIFFYSAGFEGNKKSAISNWEDANYLPMVFLCDIGIPGSINASRKTIEISAIFNHYLADHSEADLNEEGVINFIDLTSRRLDDYRMVIDIDSDGLVDFPDYANFVGGNFDPVPAATENPSSFQITGSSDYITASGLSLSLVQGGIVLEDASFREKTPPKQKTATVP